MQESWPALAVLLQIKARKIVAGMGGKGSQGPQLSKQTLCGKETLHTSTFPAHHRATKQPRRGCTANFSCTWQLIQSTRAENEMGINKGKTSLCLPLPARLRTLTVDNCGPSGVGRRRPGARRMGTDGRASTGTFQLSDSAGCQISPSQPPTPHTALRDGDATASTGAQGSWLLPPQAPYVCKGPGRRTQVGSTPDLPQAPSTSETVFLLPSQPRSLLCAGTRVHGVFQKSIFKTTFLGLLDLTGET